MKKGYNTTIDEQEKEERGGKEIGKLGKGDEVGLGKKGKGGLKEEGIENEVRIEEERKNGIILSIFPNFFKIFSCTLTIKV